MISSGVTPAEPGELVAVGFDALGLGSFPVSSTAFIPNRLDMKDSGSCLVSMSALD